MGWRVYAGEWNIFIEVHSIQKIDIQGYMFVFVRHFGLHSDDLLPKINLNLTQAHTGRKTPHHTHTPSYLTTLALWQENVSKSHEILVRKK